MDMEEERQRGKEASPSGSGVANPDSLEASKVKSRPPDCEIPRWASMLPNIHMGTARYTLLG